ncbi:unnamed protein product [Peniophora sp. CBMAI 1063]|nr:unnamed protein product [Peniophora sp. CBMAI 1063]
MLLSLPSEDIVHILELCNFRDIISCSMACRRLNYIATGFESLVYIVSLAAAGLQTPENWTPDATLTASEKLTHVQEYDSSGSRGGQLLLFSLLPEDTIQVSGGLRLGLRRMADNMMHLSLHDLGGPRSLPSSQVLPIIPLPDSTRTPICMVDSAHRVMVVVYETGRQWDCSVLDFASLGLSRPITTYNVGSMEFCTRAWQVCGNTLIYCEYPSPHRHPCYHVKDVRSGDHLLTIDDPFPAPNMSSTKLVAEDMMLRVTHPEPPLIPEDGQSPELHIEAFLLNGTTTPTSFILELPVLNDQYLGAFLWFDRDASVDGDPHRFDGLATSDDERLFHLHFSFRCPTAMDWHHTPCEYTRDDILLLVHVNGLRALLRSLSPRSRDSSYVLTWEEWAGHARLMVLRPPPIPVRMEWRSSASTSGMRLVLWFECWRYFDLDVPASARVHDASPPAMRQLVLIDVHPRRVARRAAEPQVPFALSKDLRGTGRVSPFKDWQNVYHGGLSCVEYTYVLPPEVARSVSDFDVAAALDGVVVKTRKLPGNTPAEFQYCTIPRLEPPARAFRPDVLR